MMNISARKELISNIGCRETLISYMPNIKCIFMLAFILNLI